MLQFPIINEDKTAINKCENKNFIDTTKDIYEITVYN